MIATEIRPQRDRPRRPAPGARAVVLAALVVLSAGAARAQQVRIPDVVLAQVLGTVPEEAGRATEAPDAGVERVAHRMRQRFEDQLVAGVERPSVELEVHFDWDSDQIHAESAPEIEAAARVLNQHFPAQRFQLAGYTDESGEADYNLDLSRRRATAVRRELVERYGVAGERLDPVGYGEANPLGDVSAEQRRRVELQILREATDAR
jgi:outer membrane protein OmpA-like peptidoglycan-associated protein